MKWASTVSAESVLKNAVGEVTETVRRDLGGQAPDLVVVFASAHHRSAFNRLPALVSAELDARVLIGCSAGGVIGGAREIEEAPGLSLTAAILPDVELTPFHLESDRLPAPSADTAAWENLFGLRATENPRFVLLPDPQTFDTETLVQGLDRAYPHSPKVGGLASGGQAPGANALFLGDRVHRSGAVGIALRGNVELDTIVAQGCRPVGEPMFATRCERNIIWQLDGRRPLDVLQELHPRLSQRDQELARRSLFLGIAMNENREEYRRGDFLIRNLLGVDPDSGALAVGGLLTENTVVQFHLRDAKTSAEDLEELLASYQATHSTARPEGSLLFSCLGRGQHLYGTPDHDSKIFRRHLGEIALGGFFCNGEIGPVHGTTFLHGYTSSFGLFRRKE